MFKLLRRGWRYVVAALSGKLDEVADPKVQIEQAIAEAKRQHALLSQQAAAVLGNRHQVEMRLERAMGEVEKLQASARQSLVLAEQARAAGDEARAADLEATAQTFATQLVTAEKAMEDLKEMHDQSLQAAQAARKAVEQNAMLLQRKLAERTKLLSQLDQAKMQERVNEALQSVSALAESTETPSFDEVRDKIEGRYARARGAAELAENSVEARMLEVERSTIDMEGAQRLESIRASMGLTKPATAPAAAPATEAAPATSASTAAPTAATDAKGGAAAGGATPAKRTPRKKSDA